MTYRVKFEHNEDVIGWLLKNCSKHYRLFHLNSYELRDVGGELGNHVGMPINEEMVQWIEFDDEDDAILFKLTWGGGNPPKVYIWWRE